MEGMRKPEKEHFGMTYCQKCLEDKCFYPSFKNQANNSVMSLFLENIHVMCNIFF